MFVLDRRASSCTQREGSFKDNKPAEPELELLQESMRADQMEMRLDLEVG